VSLLFTAVVVFCVVIDICICVASAHSSSHLITILFCSCPSSCDSLLHCVLDCQSNYMCPWIISRAFTLVSASICIKSYILCAHGSLVLILGVLEVNIYLLYCLQGSVGNWHNMDSLCGYFVFFGDLHHNLHSHLCIGLFRALAFFILWWICLSSAYHRVGFSLSFLSYRPWTQWSKLLSHSQTWHWHIIGITLSMPAGHYRSHPNLAQLGHNKRPCPCMTSPSDGMQHHSSWLPFYWHHLHLFDQLLDIW